MRQPRWVRAPRTVAAVLVAATVLLAGCGDDAPDPEAGAVREATPVARTATALATSVATGDAGTGASAPAGTMAAAPPAGWKAFNASAYSGAIPDGWEFFEFTVESLTRNESLRDALRGAGADDALMAHLRDSLAAFGPNARLGIVLLKNDRQFRTNVTVLPCDDRNWTADEWTRAQTREAEREGTRLNRAGTATIAGRRADVYRYETATISNVSTHIAFTVSARGCGYAFTLSERPGAPSVLPQFVAFLETLRFDAARAPGGG